MNKKGIELAFSKIIVILLLVLFLLVMLGIFVIWRDQSSTVLNSVFGAFGR